MTAYPPDTNIYENGQETDVLQRLEVNLFCML